MKTTLQKESPNPWLRRRTQILFKIGFLFNFTQFQLYLKETSTHVLYCEFAKFFDSKPSMASAKLLFLIKSNRVDLVITRDIYILLIETISTLLLITCRNQKLVQNKPLQQRLFDLILGFWKSFLII